MVNVGEDEGEGLEVDVEDCVWRGSVRLIEVGKGRGHAHAKLRYRQVNRTSGSKQIMRSGRVSTVVTMCLRSVFSSSIGAMMDASPDSLRMRCARYLRITGPYVSGKKKNSGHEAPAKMAPIQNAQLQLTTEMNPLMGGPRIGPNVVAACAPHKHC